MIFVQFPPFSSFRHDYLAVEHKVLLWMYVLVHAFPLHLFPTSSRLIFVSMCVCSAFGHRTISRDFISSLQTKYTHFPFFPFIGPTTICFFSITLLWACCFVSTSNFNFYPNSCFFLFSSCRQVKHFPRV